RPSLVMPTRTTWYFSRQGGSFSAPAQAAAEMQLISCSLDTPPKNSATRSGFAVSLDMMQGLLSRPAPARRGGCRHVRFIIPYLCARCHRFSKKKSFFQRGKRALPGPAAVPAPARQGGGLHAGSKKSKPHKKRRKSEKITGRNAEKVRRKRKKSKKAPSFH